MLGTCRNVVAGWRRGERRRADLAVLLATDQTTVVAPRPPESSRLLRCLTGLAERERAVLLLSFCEDHEAEAIGALLGLSAGNVRVIRHRALRAIKTCLDGAAP
jgi:RNA polymerase sigma-70 factor (ECF subfamily)